ncbi:hypothetical protein [Idiomarina piscisalsi]|uniref:hypothetical protein n=1 Tax=Idiomarina piscisalsi TaxID=1096243 RepID=UPI00138006D8|nr:hypothetical protein [Idiomarina piscisalsi]MTJ02271.1 glycosyltransferase family 4 protein [Idiomarina piscisalsi]
MREEVVIVTQTFYPDPSVGALRMVELTRYLLSKGYQVTIFCKYQGFSVESEIIKKEFRSSDISIFYLDRNGIKGEGGLRRNSLKSHIKRQVVNFLGNMAVPDFSVFFWRKSFHKIFNYVSEKKVKKVITSSPPHSVHYIGKELKKKLHDINWIADFRDPYLIDFRYSPRKAGKLFYHFHKKFYRKVLENADEILFAIPIDFRWARNRYRNFKSKFTLILNGAPDFLAEIKGNSNFPKKPNVNIASIGRIDTNVITHLYRSLKGKEYLERLDVVGVDIYQDLKLGTEQNPKITFHSQMAHREALSYLLSADILISALSEKRQKARLLSSKLFEYCYTGKPLLLINPTLSDRWLVRNYRRKVILYSPDADQLSESIDKLHSLTGVASDLQPQFLRKEQFRNIKSL